MSNRFYAHPSQVARSARLVLVAAALLGVALVPAFTAAAQAGAASRIAATLFQIEAPQPYSMVTNGTPVVIAGWTSGTEVDLYLDGPAGVGTGIGTVQVHGARPDVASIMGAGNVLPPDRDADGDDAGVSNTAAPGSDASVSSSGPAGGDSGADSAPSGPAEGDGSATL